MPSANSGLMRNERDLGRIGCRAVERARRHIDRRDAVSGRRHGPAGHRIVPVRHRLCPAAAARAVAGRALAAAPRLARGRGPGAVVLCRVSHPVQRFADLHDRGARRAGAFHLAPADHDRRRSARKRAAERTQDHRRAGRDIRRFPGVAGGFAHCAGRRLARRSPDDRSRLLHGALQHLVKALHRAAPVPFPSRRWRWQPVQPS